MHLAYSARLGQTSDAGELQELHLHVPLMSCLTTCCC